MITGKDQISAKAEIREKYAKEFNLLKKDKEFFNALKKEILQSVHLITDKPVMYIANVDEDGFENNPHLP